MEVVSSESPGSKDFSQKLRVKFENIFNNNYDFRILFFVSNTFVSEGNKAPHYRPGYRLPQKKQQTRLQISRMGFWDSGGVSAMILHYMSVTDNFQGGPRTEPEPETGTAGTVFAGTERRTGTAGTVFQEPK